MTPLKVRIKKTHPQAIIPQQATDGSAAVDLHAALDAPVTLLPGERRLISTGIAIELPSPAFVALLFARSGLAVRDGIALANGVGVIDSDYRGTVSAGLVNLGADPYTVKNGDRIAQLVIFSIVPFSFRLTEELSDTARGDGGFGSTGKGPS